MKAPGLKQSRILIKSNSLVDEEFQFDNPQNNFQKLLSLPLDTPARQFRGIIQSMSEHCSFEKNLIKKTANIEVPRYVKSQMKKNEIYNNYQAIKNYTIFTKNKQHFQGRKFTTKSQLRASDLNKKNKQSAQHTFKQQKQINKQSGRQKQKDKNQKQKNAYLLDFVQSKKNKMLLQQNLIKKNHNQVSNILNNSHRRQQIFQEALLLQRMYDIQIDKLRKVGILQTTNQVPQKFRGVQPRHIRINSQACQTEEQYLRKKYVCKKRKLQFFGHARKIEQSSLKNKKKQNFGVLQTLIKYNESKGSNYLSHNYFESNQQVSTDVKIKRLFLCYACCEADNPQEMYKYITDDGIKQFFRDFNIQNKMSQNLGLAAFLQQKRKKNKNQTYLYLTEIDQKTTKYHLFDFIQIIYILAAEQSTLSQNHLLQGYLQEQIWPISQKAIPKQWLILKNIKQNNKMVKYIKMLKFEQLAKKLFYKKLKQNFTNQFSTPLLEFNDLLEMAWQIKLFPIKITKKSLRFMYLYCKSHENGISMHDFFDLILVAGIKFGPQNTSLQQKLKWIIQQIAK